MDSTVLHQLTAWVRSYVDHFRDEQEALHPMMELKLAHTARVALLSRTIAERSAWSPSATNLAEAGGWLHDIGRFSQWAEFGTYRDRDSVDHARRGHEVLTHQAPLALLTVGELDRLLASVALHNRLALPDALSPDTRALCQIVRDADKLDIYDVVYQHLREGKLARLVPALSTDPEATPELLTEIRTSHRASYRNVRTQADFVLTSVAWAYDFAFPATASLVCQKQAIARLAPFLPEAPEVQATVQAAVEHLRAESHTAS